MNTHTPILNALESVRLALSDIGLRGEPQATATRAEPGRLVWFVYVETDHFAGLRVKRVGGIADSIEEAARMTRTRLTELVAEKAALDARRAKRVRK